MKNLKLLMLIVFGALLVTFASCDKAKDLANITFDATLSTDISAQSNGETREGVFSFSGNEVIDPATDENIEKYWDNIVEWVGKDIFVEVKSIDEPANLTNGHLLIRDNTTEEVLYTADADNMLLESGTKILHVTNADWAKLISALNAKHKFYVEVAGDLDKSLINITFKVVLNTEVTANPL